MRIWNLFYISLLSFFWGILISCDTVPENAQYVDKLPIIYPDYTGVTIPDSIAPLDFSMADDSYSKIYVEIKGARGGEVYAEGHYADFDIDEWHHLVSINKGSTLRVTVYAEREGHWTKFREFPIYVSRYGLGDWGITYRRIAPSYESYSDMGIYERDLSNFEERALLVNAEIGGMCVNCHTPNATRPNQYVFHVRGENGCTYIHHDGKSEVLQAKNAELGGSMVYPSWHPSGRYCAFSTNKTSQMFHFSKARRIEVYDSSSDIFVYDVAKHTILCDTTTMTQLNAENCPAFSGDGKWLYFTSARRQSYPDNYDKERYDLCRIAFDSSKGRFVGRVDTLVHASAIAKSITWPRPSYDGRYVMYTQMDYGYFSVWHPEADLYLLDLRTMQARPLHEVNSRHSESLHAWTANSHWFLFTSRRDDDHYTRIYLSSIDDKGRATKPFLLPQRDAKRYYARSLYSYNTPDFASKPAQIDCYDAGREIMRPERIATKILRK